MAGGRASVARACKPGYHKVTKTAHVIRNHKRVTTHHTVCAKAGSKPGGSTSGGSGSGGGSGGSGSGGSGGGSSAGSGPPVAVADSYTVAADRTLTVAATGVLANDRGSGLSALVITNVADGTLSLSRSGSFTYTPTPGFVGTDRFTYKDLDSSYNSSNVASVTLSVTPLVADASYEAQSGTQLSVGAPGVLAGSVGTGLSANLVSGVNHGALTLNHDGSFSYAATPGYTGSDGFTYDATDASGAVSNVATVSIAVGVASGPAVVPETFTGEVANTELQAGGVRGSGPEVYLGSANALAGDSDPNGGTLSTTAATITTSQGGTVTMAADGTFTYAPPVAFQGTSDSFSYQVDASGGLHSNASATIDFARGRVWYVDDSAGSGGNGTSAAPFNTLASASAASSAGDVIFLAGGGAPYGGGITLKANQMLDGASAGLVVGGTDIFPASGSAPELTNSGGAGITLAEGADVEGVAVTDTSGAGIVASSVNSFTLGSGVSVSGAGGDGLDVTAGNGTIAAATQIGGSTGHSVAITERTGGTVTLSGSIGDTGDGIALTDNTGATIDITGTLTASTATQPAFTATGGGTVALTGSHSTLSTTTATALDVENTTISPSGLNFQAISAGTPSSGPAQAIVLANTGGSGGLNVTGTGTAASGGTIDGTTGSGAVTATDAGSLVLNDMNIENSSVDGVYADNVGWLSLTASAITGSGGIGVIDTDDGTSTPNFEIGTNTLIGQSGTAIDLAFAGAASGTVDNNVIGNGTAASGSQGGDGIDVSTSSGLVEVALNTNTIKSIASGHGIAGTALGSGDLSLTVTGNAITMGGSGSQDAMAYASNGSGPSTLCLNASANTGAAAGADANGTSVTQDTASSVFDIQGYTGGAFDTSAAAAFLEGLDPGLDGGTDGASVVASILGGNTEGFAGAACPAPGGGTAT